MRLYRDGARLIWLPWWAEDLGRVIVGVEYGLGVAVVLVPLHLLGLIP